MTAPRVVVVMAAYMGEGFIRQQVQSILAQLGVEISLLISDDGSTDETRAVIDALCDRRIRWVKHSELPRSACRNFLQTIAEIDMEDFDYVALSDQDDVWLPSKLVTAIQHLSDHQAMGYSSNVTAFWPDGTTREVIKSKPQRRWDYLFESGGPGCTFVFRRAYAEHLIAHIKESGTQIGVLKFHDWYIYALARHAGYKWVIDARSSMLYRQHAGNVQGANVSMAALMRRLSDLRSGWYRLEVLRVANAVGATNEAPIQWMSRFGWLDRIRLARIAMSCRRGIIPPLLWAFAVIVFVSRSEGKLL